jgi:hypothetical protein
MGICTSAGACATVGQVVFVDNRGSTKSVCDGVHSSRNGTLGDPFCDISEALPSPSPFVLVRGTSQAYDVLNIPNSASLTLTIVGPGLNAATPATITPSSNNVPAVSVTSDSVHALTITLDGLIVANAGGTGNGIQCTGTVTTSLTKLTVVRTIIEGNAQVGLTATNCQVIVDETIVGPVGAGSTNSGGGISLASCLYTLTNTVIHHNGSAAATKALLLSGPGNASNQIINLTIADNISNGTAAGLYCTETTNPTVFNIALNGNTTADVTGCTLSTSAYKGGTGTNQDTTACASGDLFLAPASYNYTPKIPPGGSCTVALANSGSKTGAPDHDILGSPRPQPIGSNPDVGAYEVP